MISSIDKGMVVLVAAEIGDAEKQVEWMSNRLIGLRIFEDEHGNMNLDAGAVGAAFLVVSNFTVAGDAQKGRRPSFDRAAPYEQGKVLFDALVNQMTAGGAVVKTGRYGAEMSVEIHNDGPITIIVETPR
jgi:D-tyrosyl-tRNA(Tyr) deacylase